jgi:hypothetical protein
MGATASFEKLSQRYRTPKMEDHNTLVKVLLERTDEQSTPNAWPYSSTIAKSKRYRKQRCISVSGGFLWFFLFQKRKNRIQIIINKNFLI